MVVKMKKYTVFFEQINQVGYEVRANDREEAIKKAKKIWKDEYQSPWVTAVE